MNSTEVMLKQTKFLIFQSTPKNNRRRKSDKHSNLIKPEKRHILITQVFAEITTITFSNG